MSGGTQRDLRRGGYRAGPPLREILRSSGQFCDKTILLQYHLGRNAAATPMGRDWKQSAMHSVRELRRKRELRVMSALRELYSVTRTSYRMVERRTGVSMATMRALAHIAERPGLGASALARELGLHKSTASNLLREFGDRGWVQRRRQASDQRAVRILLTPEGQKIVRRAGLNARGLLATLTESLTDRELALVERGLRPITKRLLMRLQ